MTKYELYHHGILGMKWGIRRFQNPDGSLTPAGRRRYDVAEGRLDRKTARKLDKKEINITTFDLWKNSPNRTPYTYRTYRRAAKYMVKKGYDKKTALRIAKNQAWVKTGMLAVAGYSAYKIGKTLYKIKASTLK